MRRHQAGIDIIQRRLRTFAAVRMKRPWRTGSGEVVLMAPRRDGLSSAVVITRSRSSMWIHDIHCQPVTYDDADPQSKPENHLR